MLSVLFLIAVDLVQQSRPRTLGTYISLKLKTWAVLFLRLIMASSGLIFGLFSVSNGRRDTTRTTHCVYTTYIQCDNGTSIEGEIRVYCPASRALLPDESVVFLYAKFAAPDNANMLLEAIRLIPFIGDETSEEYQAVFPEPCFAVIVAYGSVPGPHSTNDNRKYFPLAISDYVRDATQPSLLESVTILSVPFLSLTFLLDVCLIQPTLDGPIHVLLLQTHLPRSLVFAMVLTDPAKFQ